MMISPETYVNQIKDKSYKELLKEKEEIMKKIKDFENNPVFDVDYNPAPDVVYQCNLLYLAKLCELIAEKFNKEYEW